MFRSIRKLLASTKLLGLGRQSARESHAESSREPRSFWKAMKYFMLLDRRQNPRRCRRTGRGQARLFRDFKLDLEGLEQRLAPSANPVIGLNVGPNTVSEGSLISRTGTFFDSDSGDVVTITPSVGNVVQVTNTTSPFVTGNIHLDIYPS